MHITKLDLLFFSFIFSGDRPAFIIGNDHDHLQPSRSILKPGHVQEYIVQSTDFGGKTILFQTGDEGLRKWIRTHHSKRVVDEQTTLFDEFHFHFVGENPNTPTIPHRLDFDPRLQWHGVHNALEGIFIILKLQKM